MPVLPENVSSVGELVQVFHAWGWVGVAAGTVWLFVKMWRSGTIDRWLGAVVPGLRFDGWMRFVRLGAVIFLSFIAAVLSGLAAGKSLMLAIAGGVPVAMGAIGWNEILKTVTKASDERSLRTTLELPTIR